MSRNATTIILLTRNELVRADFSRGGREVSGLWRQPRPDLPDLTSVVETALLQAPGVGRRVWVLSTDLWTQTLSLPGLKMAGLTAEQKASALNFEAEGMSGHPAFDSVVGYTTQPAEGQEAGFWLVQTPAAPLAQIDDAVQRAGGRLAGVAHPAGLPMPLGGKSVTTWQRVELWPDALVCLGGNGDGRAEVQVFNFDPQGGRWQGQVDQWRAAHGTPDRFEMLVSADVNFTAPRDDVPVAQLSDDTALRRWLSAWASRLEEKTVRVPYVKPPPRPLSLAQRKAIAYVLMAIVGILCAGHYFLWLQPRLAAKQADLQAAQKPRKDLDEMQKKTKEMEARRLDIQKQLDGYRALATQRHRHAKLLAILGEQRPNDLVIQKIDVAGGELTIHGACLKETMADELAHALVKQSQDLRWEIGQSNKQALRRRADGGPWTFDLTLKELGTESAATTPKLPPKRR